MLKPIPVPENEAGVRKTFVDMDLGRIIPLVMKAIDRGKSVKQISARHKIPEGLTEEITRMYLTHPGIDTEGIRTRIEGPGRKDRRINRNNPERKEISGGGGK